MFDKFNFEYQLINMNLEGISSILNQARRDIPRNINNRGRNIFLLMGFIIHRVTAQNRADKAAGKMRTLDTSNIPTEYTWLIHFIAEGNLPEKLKPGLAPITKHLQKLRREEDLYAYGSAENFKGETEPNAKQSRQTHGCIDFTRKGSCPRGEGYPMVHSDQACCANGPECRFLKSKKGCVFKGEASH